MKPLAAGVTMVLGVSLFSCSPGYVLRAGWEEARILARRRSMEDVLNDPTIDSDTRAKLEIVVQARSFAQQDLHLDVGDSYTSFSDIGRDTLALVLSASPVDKLSAYTWWFPIVGRVPYKGFFTREAAEKEQQKLEAQHFDTYLRTTSAFSTLGWFPDPLLNTVLGQDSVGLVETVIHEVTHNTLFVSGHVKFNESFANFVGSVGALEFFCDRGHDESLCELAQGRWYDTVLLSGFLDDLWNQLVALYEEDLPYDSLMPRRRALLQEAAELYRDGLAPGMKTRAFVRYDPTRLNNASLVARHLYYHRLSLFQELYKESGSLTQAVERIAAAVRNAEEPWGALERLLENEVEP